MNARSVVPAKLLCAAVVAQCLFHASPASAADPHFADARRAFVNAEMAMNKGRAALRLLDDLSVGHLQQLVFDDDPSVALCAAWRRMELQSQALLLGPARGTYNMRIPDELLREFVGFVEGRLGVPAPDGWSQTISTSRIHRSDYIEFTAIEPFQPPHLFDESLPERYAMPVVQIALSPDQSGAIFRGDPESFEGEGVNANLPDEIVAAIEAESESQQVPYNELVVTGIATNRRAVIILPGGQPGNEEAVCFERLTLDPEPEILWRAQLDSFWAEPYRGPAGYTEFRLRNDVLYLFHYCGISIGIEGLRLDDGSRVFSFNSRLPQYHE